MAKFNFTATHGVHLWDLDVQFTRAEDRIDEDGRGHAVYVYSTDSTKTADALRKVEGYGIAEAKAAPAEH